MRGHIEPLGDVVESEGKILCEFGDFFFGGHAGILADSPAFSTYFQPPCRSP